MASFLSHALAGKDEGDQQGHDEQAKAQQE
jgi:hypothetical protein